MNTLPEMLQKTIQAGASDLHLTIGVPAKIRVDGKLRAIDQQSLNAADTKRLAYSVMTDGQKHQFEEKWEIDFSFGECGGHQKTRIQRDDRWSKTPV
jgi:twitching motility protein PilT